LEEEQKTQQWPKEKVQNNDIQNTTHKTIDRVTRTLLKQSVNYKTLHIKL